MARFNSLAIENPHDLIFGRAPHPVKLTPEITAGNGETFPELNYILPYGTKVHEDTLGDVVALYRTMAQKALERAADLGIPKLVIEIELVFELTLNPAWGEQVIAATREVAESFKERGVHTAIRATIADIRDRVRPPRNRSADEVELVFESFERCAPHCDILSIETTGGKEVSDEAILQCNAGGVVFALGELASRDMEFVWTRVVDIAKRHNTVPGGDAACGFANTAMQLAHKKMIPTVFAAMVRAVGAARSLVAVECGATGPDKDCAYEGPVLKAIAGIPISMEGASAACAHSSPLGNVAMVCCDLWSNESVPYAQLFGGTTPEVCLEQLWYDCKLMNTSIKKQQDLVLRDLLSESDIYTSAEALILAPESCIRIAHAIVKDTDYVQRCYNAAVAAVDIMDEAIADNRLTIPEREQTWLPMLRQSLDEFAGLEGNHLSYYQALFGDNFIPEEYGLEPAGV